MGVKKNISLIVFLLTSGLLLGQEINYQQEYLNAKDFFRSGRYGLAQDTFQKLTEESSDNPFHIYASYYYALSAYRQDYLSQARDMFNQILTKYPDWEQNEEVNYWLATIHFKNREYEKALLNTSMISNSEINELERFYMQEVNSVDSLVNLFELFPDNYAVAEQLAYMISKQNFLDQDLELLDSLSSRFEIPFLDNSIQQQILPKEEYNISILFPFLSSELSPTLNPKVNQFVIDLYQGILLAADSLNKMGGKLNFTLFDTQRDTTVIQSFLNDNRLKESDLIIGPLYHAELLSEFAFKNRVNILHPYAKDQSLIENNPYFFLYSNLPRTIGEKAASMVLQDTTMKTGIVFYGESARDSIMALSFVDSVRDNGFEVVLAKKIKIGEEREAMRVLTSETVVNKLELEEVAIAPDSIDLVFVASNNPGGSVYANILTGIEARTDTIPVFGSRNWVDDNVVSKSVLERLNVTMAAYDFINYSDSSYYTFNDDYIYKFGTAPSKFSAIGYDMMFYFGQSMQKYGKYFQLGLKDEGFVPGTLSYGFDYTESNSNSVVPIIKWDGNNIILVDKLLLDEDIELELEDEDEEREK